MSKPPASRLYRTERRLIRTLRITYRRGAAACCSVRRDRDCSIELVAVSEHGNVSTFEVEAHHPSLYFKPCLVESGATHWGRRETVGDRLRVMIGEVDARSA